MASFDALAPDQRAVVQLVLGRGNSYDEIAQMLSIDRAAVRERALAALDAIGPQNRIEPQRRALITDYLLGQLPPRVAEDVKHRLAGTPSERAWARVVAAELTPVAEGHLPEIPAAEPVRRDRDRPQPAPAQASSPAATARASEEPAPANARERSAARAAEPPASRRGGAVLLGLAVLVIAVVAAVAIASGGSSSKSSSSASTQAQVRSTPTTATTSTTPKVVHQINLVSATGAKSTVGLAQVVRQSGLEGLVLVATGLKPNSAKPPNAYAVWLFKPPAQAKRLGFVNPGVGSTGRFQIGVTLPSNAAQYTQLLVTLETQANPTQPGQIVLNGALGLG